MQHIVDLRQANLFDPFKHILSPVAYRRIRHHFEARRNVEKCLKSSQTAGTGRVVEFTPGSAQQRPRTLSARRMNNHFCRRRLIMAIKSQEIK
jgi:hypothetical protein